MRQTRLAATCLVAAACVSAAVCARGQIVIQQPVLGIFAIRTTVTVPDGGTMRLGGVNRYSAGSVDRGVPGLSSIPGLNRGFRNRAIGAESGTSQMSVTATVISLREMEEQIMAEAENRIAQRQKDDPNGPVDIQRKADFITRNIGKTTSRR